MDEENNGPGPKLKKMVGENTTGIRTNKKGQKYTTFNEDVNKGQKAGDSLFIGNVPLIKNRTNLAGGDYAIEKTGPKKYELKGNWEPEGEFGSTRRKTEYDQRNWKYDKTINK